MQRVMHSIVTARILLNLRQAVTVDRAKRAASEDGGVDDTNGSRSTPTALSSVIIGVDTWFHDESAEVE